ncbi:MAG TPA: ester cyclase [Gaiellaceae bacterium]|jgi:steroid delta-isomerase-like uncharacterized protein|nr:ester cyclase [Gaiellaceae bacterium]
MSANKKLLDRYVERYNAGDLDGVMDLYAEDAEQNMPDGTFVGRDAIRDRLAQELIAFPDVNHVVRSFVEQGDAFCDEWTFAGTHTGSLLLPDGRELAPTGQRIEVRGMEYCRVNDDGKLTLDTLYYDNVDVMVQLGLLPEAVPA